MSEQTPPKKQKRLSRREFLIVLGVGVAGLYAGVKLGSPPLRLRLAEWLEESGGPPTKLMPHRMPGLKSCRITR